MKAQVMLGIHRRTVTNILGRVHNNEHINSVTDQGLTVAGCVEGGYSPLEILLIKETFGNRLITRVLRQFIKSIFN